MQNTEQATTFNTARILEVLALEETGADLYRGESHFMGSPNIFGGQLLGQALHAAAKSAGGRRPNSLHAMFVAPGDHRIPVDYAIERTRDGRSFTTRRVVATQDSRTIFTMSVSFHCEEVGLTHQVQAPQVLSADALPPSLPPWRQRHGARDFSRHPTPVEFRVAPSEELEDGLLPRQRVWLRAPQDLPDGALAHECLFTYVSDYGLLWTSLKSHGIHVDDKRLQAASLDHTIWFHRPFRIDDWLLYAMESPSAAGGRGLNLAHVYDSRGALVATVAQEGLIRLRQES